ncbi:hypothetical protein [Sphingomonas sp. LC-1]|uniref:hypothetical protein n=1 Tax=Sphingomonas sp. LC-1 TaxID=3110957 RepID=UPI0021BA4932|nr:hypothetical protein [Sphingomonas sp. LC-1]
MLRIGNIAADRGAIKAGSDEHPHKASASQIFPFILMGGQQVGRHRRPPSD